MLFWHEDKSCQAITCFVKHARACLSVFQPNTTENFWGQWWGRWAEKLAWQNLVINCEWNFCTWVSSLHLLTGDLDTTSEPNFVECYLAWILMVTEMGCWAKIQVQSVKSLIKHIERPEFFANWTNRHHGTCTDRTKLKLSLSFHGMHPLLISSAKEASVAEKTLAPETLQGRLGGSWVGCDGTYDKRKLDPSDTPWLRMQWSQFWWNWLFVCAD